MTSQGLSPKLLWLLILASALSVGNIYYSQPLLGQIEETFNITAAQAGLVSMFTQLGYVCGLIFIGPLGDVADKRKILFSTFLAASFIMLGSAFSSSFILFTVLAFLLGLVSVAVQLIIPFIADLSSSAERGKNMGYIISSALLGILLSRSLSGFMGSHFGWRSMYFLGAGLMLALAISMRVGLPKGEVSDEHLPYPQLIRSLWTLFSELRDLRLIALTGAFNYGAFTAFWASLAFYLHSPTYNLGPGTAGAFGIVGAGGALASNLAGRYVEKIGAKKLVFYSILGMALSYIVMGLFGSMMVGLVVGVLILDMAAQSASISNQTEIYRLYTQARTRLNTIYKILYFIGGASGAAFSALAWQHFGWSGVCVVGLIYLSFSLMNHIPLMVKQKRAKAELKA